MLWKVEQLLTVETRTYFLAVSFSVLVSRFHFPIVQKLFHNLIGSVLVSLACWTLPETTSELMSHLFQRSLPSPLDSE